MNSTDSIKDQAIGSIAEIINNNRIDHMNDLIINQEQNLEEAMKYVDSIKKFLAKPENILGSDKTKFGEIAEHVEVGIRNAKDALNGRTITATFEGVGRTAPEDYIVDGVQVQSKFINGVNNNLRHVLEHMNKYKNFSDDGYYHIPKDNFEILNKIKNGEYVDGLHSRTIEAAKKLIQDIEIESGKSFSDVVKPAISSYEEVQQGSVNDTIGKYEKKFKEEVKEKESKVILDHQPSFDEALKIGVIGAAIGGGFSAVSAIYLKCKNEDKNIMEFSNEDWKNIGVDFLKGSCKGGINGIALYSLTNFTEFSAPVASAFVSASWGVSFLVIKYKRGEITLEDLYEQGQLLCLETGAVALGSIIGQTIIPVPVVGTLIGSIAAQTLISITKDKLGDKEDQLRNKLLEEYNNKIKQIDINYKAIMENIMLEFERLGGMVEMAFNFNSNSKLRFDSSIKLARMLNVKEDEILKNIDDIDDFFLN